MQQELYHFGVKGMRWGIRRYQNKDGSLTPEGRKRLKLDKYDNNHGEDIVIKKGTKANRIVKVDRYEEHADPQFGGNKKKAEAYVKKVLERDRMQDTKYFSVDGVRNSGRLNGKDFYVSWFSDGGWDPDSVRSTDYTLKKDVKIASGKKVMDELLKEAGPEKVKDMVKEGTDSWRLALDYTQDKELFNRVNKKFQDMGYDGVEDVNDPDTDMPIILFDSTKKAIRDAKVQTGREAIDEILKKYGKKAA